MRPALFAVALCLLVAPAAQAQRLTGLKLKPKISHGKVRGTVSATPAGASMKVVLRARGRVVKRVVTQAGRTAFALRLPRGARTGKKVNVGVTCKLKTSTGIAVIGVTEQLKR